VSADAPEQPEQPEQPAAPAAEAPKRRRLVMIGSGPDYVDGDIRVLPLDDAERLINLGHARGQGKA
jgi:hypothetical protein